MSSSYDASFRGRWPDYIPRSPRVRAVAQPRLRYEEAEDRHELSALPTVLNRADRLFIARQHLAKLRTRLRQGGATTPWEIEQLRKEFSNAKKD